MVGSKRVLGIAAVALIVLLGVGSRFVTAAEKEPLYVPGELIVKLKDGKSLDDIQALNVEYNVTTVKKVFADSVLPQDTLRRLKDKLAALSVEHQSWYWQLDKNSQEYKDYIAKIEKEKAQLQQAIKAEEDLIAHMADRQARASQDASPPDISNTYLLKAPTIPDVKEMTAAYRQNPAVKYAEPNYKVKVEMVPNDPYYSGRGDWGQSYDDLWGLKKIQAANAWDIAKGQGIIVAVIDTGIDYTHPDIAANVWTNPLESAGNGLLDDDGNGYADDIHGYNFVAGTGDPMDDHGHGTHCAGIIAALGNNGVGVIGVAPQAKVMAVKSIYKDGTGTYSDLIAGMRYAVDNGADVLSNSWGGGVASQAMEDMVRYAYSKGCVVVFAAGNSGEDTIISSPANMYETIAVGASDHNDLKASFSCFGGKVDIMAPGGGSTSAERDILSLRARDTDMYYDGTTIVGQYYARARGTSMACPHVAGLAALILSRSPNLTYDQVRQIITNSADDIDAIGWDVNTGSGRINAYKALQITIPPSIAHIASVDYNAQHVVSVTGSAYGNRFLNYTLEYATQSNPQNWIAIVSSNTPVNRGSLGQFSLNCDTQGYYPIRLTVTGFDGVRSIDGDAIYYSPSFASKWGTYGSNPGEFYLPAYLAIDSMANIYISDCFNGRVQKFSSDGTFIREWPVKFPMGITVDKDGYILVVDTTAMAIKKYSPDGVLVKQFSTSVIDRPASLPMGIATDANGYIYVSDDPYPAPCGVKKFDSQGNCVKFWGSTGAGLAEFNEPTGIAVNGQYVYVADYGNNKIMKFSLDGTYSGQFNPPAPLVYPTGIEITAAGKIYVRDDSGIQVFNLDETFAYRLASKGTCDGQLGGTDFLFMGTATQGRYTYATDGMRFRIQKLINPLSPNHAPVLNTIGSQTGTVNQALTFTLSATDIDGDTLTYSATGIPAGATLSGATFNWTPTAAGTFTVTFTVSDGKGGTASATVTITVNNAIPTITITSPNGGETWKPGSTQTITWKTTGIPQGSTFFVYMQYTNSNGPAGMYINTGASGSSYSWTVPAISSGNCKIYVYNYQTYVADWSDNPFSIDTPPVLNTIGSQTGTVNQALTFTLSATDADNDALTYSATGLPTGATLSGSQFSWTPTAAGTYTVTFTVSDGKGGTASETVTITVTTPTVTVTSPNGGETWKPGSTQTITWTTTGTPQNSTFMIYFQYQNNSGQYIGTYLTTGTSGLSYKWTVPAISSSNCKIYVYNMQVGVADWSDAAFTISTPNTPPVFNAIASQTGTVNQALTFTLSATDADNDALTYSATGLPSGATLSGATFSWTPTAAGTYTVTFSVSDGKGGAATQAVTITVNNVAPTVTVTSPNGGEVWKPGSTQTITWKTTGMPQNSTFMIYMQYLSGNSMAGMYITTNATGSSYSWQVPAISSGNCKMYVYNYQTYVSDWGDNPFSIDTPPVLTAIGSKTANVSQALTFTLSATDADNDALTYSATGLPAGATLSGSQFSWTPTAAGTYTVTFTVSDGKGGAATQAVTITVNNATPTVTVTSPNGGEVWKPGSTQTLTWKTTGMAQGSTFMIYMQYTNSSGSVGMYINTSVSGSSYSWTVPAISSNNCRIYVYNIQAGVADWSDAAFTINAPNTPPVLSAIGSKTGTVNQALTFTLSATDVDGDTLTYSATGLPPGATLSGSQFNWTPTAAGTYAVTFTVSDGKGGAASETVTITIAGASTDIIAPTGAMQINTSGEAYINTPSVYLTLSAKDNPNGSGVSQMRFSNDSITWSAAEAYATTKAWTLPSGDGTKRVYAKFSDQAGNWSTAVSATIILDTLPPTVSAMVSSPAVFQAEAGQSTTLSYSINDNYSMRLYVQVEIYNMAGNKVNVLYNNQGPYWGQNSVGSNSVVWDGKNVYGAFVPAGTYKYRIMAEDHALNWVYSGYSYVTKQ